MTDTGYEARVITLPVERTITARPGDPMAVAYAGLYLASDEAAWVTGANIVVDGGASAIM